YLGSFEMMAKVEAAAGLAPDPVRRLGALAVAVVEDAERLSRKLRLFNAEHARLVSMGDGWRRIAPGSDHEARARLYRLKPVHYTDRALLAWARSDAGAADDVWRALATLPQRWTAPAFPLRAADFIARGLERGPALGAALRAAEEAWVAADLPTDAAALAAIIDAAAQSRRSAD
ncbi:MAG TPA: CCA tRNA nucleotidyltransferase, partial [Pseudolabrys sp.]|nr:CCA tRNA nucleotidyltransferase [Pseudolabrys sp.]